MLLLAVGGSLLVVIHAHEVVCWVTLDVTRKKKHYDKNDYVIKKAQMFTCI